MIVKCRKKNQNIIYKKFSELTFDMSRNGHAYLVIFPQYFIYSPPLFCFVGSRELAGFQAAFIKLNRHAIYIIRIPTHHRG